MKDFREHLPSTRFMVRTGFLAAVGVVSLIILIVGISNAGKLVPEPPPPAPTPTMQPTWTPEPTWTPQPSPTARPITHLPQMQTHYQEYRFFHFEHEFIQCYRKLVQPPAPEPTPDGHPATKTPAEAAAEALRNRTAVVYTPPEHGLTDREVEDHLLRDRSRAITWLKAKYANNKCEELTEYTVFPRRLTWLDDHERN